jgi:methylthioribose-1-phosphate isomerase
MKVHGRHTRSIWVEADGWSIGTIDQTALPHRYATITLRTVAEAARAIST